VLNQGAPAVFYCFFFLYLSAAGPGAWSLDAKLRKQSPSETAPLRSAGRV
jgi:putative oxidoreductase